MNTANAWGFLVFGSLMNFMPTIAPALVAPPSPAGDSVASLWLHFMGAVVGTIGGGYLSRAAYRQAPTLLAQAAQVGLRTLRPITRPAARGATSRVPVGARVTAAF
jgi:hypothetical protein